MNDMSELGQLATREDLGDGAYFWKGEANGLYAAYLTKDPDLTVYVRGVSDSDHIGVEMVDQNGARIDLRLQRTTGGFARSARGAVELEGVDLDFEGWDDGYGDED